MKKQITKDNPNIDTIARALNRMVNRLEDLLRLKKTDQWDDDIVNEINQLEKSIADLAARTDQRIITFDTTPVNLGTFKTLCIGNVAPFLAPKDILNLRRTCRFFRQLIPTTGVVQQAIENSSPHLALLRLLTENLASHNIHDLLIKCCFVGDIGTGKTVCRKRFSEGDNAEFYKATIGIECSGKTYDMNEVSTKLQIWDFPGGERFGNMNRIYMREAKIYCIFFDLARICTFDAVEKWFNIIKQNHDGHCIPTIVLIANHFSITTTRYVDHPCNHNKSRAVTNGEITTLCNKLGIDLWFELDAQQSIGIDRAIRAALCLALERELSSRNLPIIQIQENRIDPDNPNVTCPIQ